MSQSSSSEGEALKAKQQPMKQVRHADEEEQQPGQPREEPQEPPRPVAAAPPAERRPPVGKKVQTLTEETATSFGVEGLRFTLKELLGSGSFGAVYQCTVAEGCDVTGLPGNGAYAVKVMEAQRLSMLMGAPLELVVPRLEREVDILFHLGMRHEGILRLHFAFFSPASAKFYLVTELLPGGDLFRRIVKRGKPFNEEDGKVIFAQLVDAVDFCHSMDVAHRDLKLENCLLVDEKSLKVKVCDYGQAKLLKSTDGLTDTSKTLTTTPCYTAPEVASAVRASSSYDAFKADSFALGVMLYALLCSALPDAAKGSAYERHSRWPKLSQDARNLIVSLLTADPSKRPLPKDMKDDPWLKSAKDRRVSQSGTVSPAWPGATPAMTPSRARLAVEALISIQEFVAGLQMERGTACWVIGSTEDVSRLDWQIKFTNEKLEAACERIIKVLSSEEYQTSQWQSLAAALCGSRNDLKQLRQVCQGKVATREEALYLDDDIGEVFDSYSTRLTNMTETMHELLGKISGSAAGGVNAVAGIQLRLLQVTAEQLARERGIIAGYLARPETFRRAAMVRKVAEVIGARRLMTGTMLTSSASVGAGQGGLPSMLGLINQPLLEASDLSSLEAVEDRALSSKKLDVLAVQEWWYHLTKAVDKLHQHIMVGISDYFSDF